MTTRTFPQDDNGKAATDYAITLGMTATRHALRGAYEAQRTPSVFTLRTDAAIPLRAMLMQSMKRVDLYRVARRLGCRGMQDKYDAANRAAEQIAHSIVVRLFDSRAFTTPGLLISRNDLRCAAEAIERGHVRKVVA